MANDRRDGLNVRRIGRGKAEYLRHAAFGDDLLRSVVQAGNPPPLMMYQSLNVVDADDRGSVKLDEALIELSLECAKGGVHETVPVVNEQAHVVPFRDDLVDQADLDSLVPVFAGDPDELGNRSRALHFTSDEVGFDSRDISRDLFADKIQLCAVVRQRCNAALDDHVEGAGHLHGHINKGAMADALLEPLQALRVGTVIESDAYDDGHFGHWLAPEQARTFTPLLTCVQWQREKLFVTFRARGGR